MPEREQTNRRRNRRIAGRIGGAIGLGIIALSEKTMVDALTDGLTEKPSPKELALMAGQSLIVVPFAISMAYDLLKGTHHDLLIRASLKIIKNPNYQAKTRRDLDRW